MPQHYTLDECPQNPALENIRFSVAHINRALERLEAHSERTATALEQIAAQGAMVAAHEKRLDSLDSLFNRVAALEVTHAREAGAEEVVAVQTKFWTDLKVQLVTPAIGGAAFLAWLADKVGAITWLVARWHEFTK